MPFCDVNAPVAVRVASLVANLTLAEKLGLFANSADGVPRLNIPSYEWWNEGLHGVAYSAGVSFGGLFPAATSFPQVITTASSFNISLYRATGEAIGREARAMSKCVFVWCVRVCSLCWRALRRLCLCAASGKQA